MNSEYDDGAEFPRDTAFVGAGDQLRAAREALGLDLNRIAADTRIPRRHLEAIEEGNFEALPSRAYAIGFSRSYAKAVGLDDAAITEVVRAELADGTMRRASAVPGMEPGDPARSPSQTLAWVGAIAALLLAAGVFAFYNTYFGAGAEPDVPLTAATPAPAATPAAAPVAPAGGQVVLTAIEDGVWVRLYEQGGARLLEQTLKRGETVIVPATAVDPRINTGRPDLLRITVDGKPVPVLADRPVTISGAQVSAAALTARSAAPVATTTAQPSEPAARSRAAAPVTTATPATPAAPPPPPAPAPTASAPAETATAAPRG